MYGARVDADGGDVDVVDPEATRPVSPPPAPTWAPKYDIGIRVVLFGLRDDAWRALNHQAGPIVKHATDAERYVVRLDMGDTVRARPGNVRPEAIESLSEWLPEAHGFDGVAQSDVRELERIHGEKHVVALLNVLISLPCRKQS